MADAMDDFGSAVNDDYHANTGFSIGLPAAAPDQDAEAVAAGSDAPRRRSTRERKAVVIEAPAIEVKEKAELEIVPGAGKPLGDIPNVALSISALKGVDNVLRKFYRAVFPGHVPLKLTIKKHLRQFSGIQEGDRDLVQSRLANLELSAELKPICQLLDISSSGTREAVVDRVVAFLLKPEASGNAYAGKPATTAVKRKRASGGKKGDKKDGPSRPMSGYMLFATEQRSTIAAKHPGASFADIGRRVGEAWKALSDAHKQVYRDRAAAQSGGAAGASGGNDDGEQEEEEGEGSDGEANADAGDDADGTADAGSKEARASDWKGDASESKDLQLLQQLEAAVKAIIASSNLDELTPKMVRTQLKERFPEDAVEAHKNEIKVFISTALA